MAKSKGHASSKKIEKFKKLHPEGRKAFAKTKRTKRLEKRYNKLTIWRSSISPKSSNSGATH